ncbi:MAG: DUF3558 domain-containing protein [Rhodococcus sp.]|nr:DUF3558 domain-containing protein [Rhodococcus sp. (in: high G+C Gram-positive bacteria)]
MKPKSIFAALAVAAAVALSACGADSTNTAPEPAGSESQAADTPEPRHTDDSGRPQVGFDPCLDIPDSALIEAGYDPASEEEADFPAGAYTFLGCQYDTKEVQYGLNVLSGNITFAEELEKVKDYSTPTEINGRQALVEVRQEMPNGCSVSIETDYGVLIIARDTFRTHSTQEIPYDTWCDGLEETASIFARHLP